MKTTAGPHVTHTIRNNTIVGSSEDGIQIIDYSANSSRSFVIERNLIRDNADAGLGLMDNGETVEDFRAASVPERHPRVQQHVRRQPLWHNGR